MKANSFKDLSKDQLEFLPSSKDKAHFTEKGWYKSPIIIPEKMIDDAITGYEELLTNKIDNSIVNWINKANDANSSFVNIEFSGIQNDKIGNLINYPFIASCVSVLIGSPVLRTFSDSIISKTPQSSTTNNDAIGWHTDKAYWPTCSSSNMLTVWIPLQDCSIDMGPVIYIDGSHNWPVDPELHKLISFRDNRDQIEKYVEKNNLNLNKTYMNLKKGQFSIHNCHLLHGSMPNTSNQNRIALALHLQDESNHYKTVYDENGNEIHISYDRLCSTDDNIPNYSDDFLFPVIFDASKN